MRNIPAITMALMLAAIILSPAVGYTIQSGSNASYSVGSNQVNYSFHAGTPASAITPASIPSSVAPTSSVTVTQVPYSIKLGASAPYSVKLLGSAVAGGVSIPPAATIGTTAAPGTEVIGAQTPAQPAQITEPAVPEENITPAEIEAPMENVTPEENVTAPTAPASLSIIGIVYDDTDENGVKEANETGLSGWVIDLEQPAGTIVANTTTDESGSYAFNDLNPGEYIVFEVLPEGWSAVMPAEGYHTVNLTDTNAENVDFANKMIVQENVTAPADTTMPEGNVTAL